MVNKVVYDCVILGAGPAGLVTGLYLGRYGYSAVIYEMNVIGGNLTQIEELKNYPGHKGSGEMLAGVLREQLKESGVVIKYGQCSGLTCSDNIYKLKIDDEDEIWAKTVVIATGRIPRTIKLPVGIDKPVSTCATCDGPLYKDKNVMVLGGGNSAATEALTLAKLATEVIIVNRSPLRADLDFVKQLRGKKNVKIFENIQLNDSDETYLRLLSKSDAVFMFLGSEPATGFLNNFRDILDDDGYILTEANNMTIKPGIFAAGDVRKGAINQVVNAAADGVVAAMGVKTYLEKDKKN